ncbi:MAG: GFA family protein [Rhodobacter sp.]|nr:GFA family protein [Rhodobacter sp.]
MTGLAGRCLCGAVRWVSDGVVTRRLACHCADCQRATSAPFTAFVGLPPETVTWSGEIAHFESSPGTHRGFCSACGTRLYFRSSRWPGEIHIHAATLEDGSGYAPDCHVVTSDSPAWLHLDDGLPSHSGFHTDPARG